MQKHSATLHAWFSVFQIFGDDDWGRPEISGDKTPIKQRSAGTMRDWMRDGIAMCTQHPTELHGTSKHRSIVHGGKIWSAVLVVFGGSGVICFVVASLCVVCGVLHHVWGQFRSARSFCDLNHWWFLFTWSCGIIQVSSCNSNEVSLAHSHNVRCIASFNLSSAAFGDCQWSSWDF